MNKTNKVSSQCGKVLWPFRLCWYCCLLWMWGHLLKMFTRSNFVRELILHFSTVASEKKSVSCLRDRTAAWSCGVFFSFPFFSLQSRLISLKFDMLSGREAVILIVVYNSGRLVRFSHFWHHESVLKAWSTLSQLYFKLCLQNHSSRDEFKLFYIEFPIPNRPGDILKKKLTIGRTPCVSLTEPDAPASSRNRQQYFHSGTKLIQRVALKVQPKLHRQRLFWNKLIQNSPARRCDCVPRKVSRWRRTNGENTGKKRRKRRKKWRRDRGEIESAGRCNVSKQRGYVRRVPRAFSPFKRGASKHFSPPPPLKS